MIGILGGTFDPIHNGHLYIAQAVSDHFAFEKILFIPCHQSPHRQPPIAPAHDRGVMVQLACNTHPLFECNACELSRPAPSYMIDTLHLLKKEYHGEKLALIIGSDAHAYFNQWRDWQEILALAELIVVNRDDETAFLNIPPCDISSTVIRQRIAENKSIRGLVPVAVEDYIHSKNLYASQ